MKLSNEKDARPFKRGELLLLIVGHSAIAAEVTKVNKASFQVQAAGTIHKESFESVWRGGLPDDVVVERNGPITGLRWKGKQGFLRPVRILDSRIEKTPKK